MKNHYQELIDSFNPSSGKELLNLNNSDATKKEQKVITWGDSIRKLISDRKTESIKNPSKTYQKYINLLHKLEREGKILNKPLSEICNKDFIDFGDFILHKLTDKEGRSNYSNIMKLFKAVHNIAADKELNNNTLRYNYNQYAPIKNSKEIFIFTEKQYEKFQLYDLSKIPQKGTDAMFKKELYRDFCIFLYEMKMRPADVIRLHTSNIITNEIKYIPEKKKNYNTGRNRTTTVPISQTAKAIISKYKDMSKKGYIFPFSMNNNDWEYTNAESWNKWQNAKQKQIEQINKFLHKFEKVLNVKKKITTYSFRHTAFTRAINSNNCNIMQLAKEGGTSVKMLEQHYYHQQY